MKALASSVAIAALTFAASADANISIPSGFSKYCSVTVPTVPGSIKWFFGTGSDPCGANIDANIRAAGLFDTVGPNQVIARCGSSLTSLNSVSASIAPGVAAINYVLADISPQNFPYCEIKVAALDMKVLQPPFKVSPALPDGFQFQQNTFDFAGFSPATTGSSLRIADYGQTAQPAPNPCGPLYTGYSCAMDYKGHDMRFGAVQLTSQETAFDIGMSEGTPLYAMAEGEVWAVRNRTVQGCYSATQGEIYILYRVGSGRYEERFMSYYAHVSDWTREPGDVVTSGSIVGHSGNTGCTGGGQHLHYSVFRLTNTARPNSALHPWRLNWSVSVDTFGEWSPGVPGRCPDNMTAPIDPFGWKAPANIDPMGHIHYDRILPDRGPGTTDLVGAGAMSIRLYKDHGHPRPCDDNPIFWTTDIAPYVTQQNPYRTCN